MSGVLDPKDRIIAEAKKRDSEYAVWIPPGISLNVDNLRNQAVLVGSRGELLRLRDSIENAVWGKEREEAEKARAEQRMVDVLENLL